jgi:DNA-binding NarL/FixJ family response regulator
VSQPRTRILLADDHALVRRGLRLILDAEPDLTVVAEAANGAEAVEAASEADVDLAILDIAMPRMTGIQAAREIARRAPAIRILMLSMYDNEQYLFESLKAARPGTCSSPSPTATSSKPAGRPCAASRTCTRAPSPRSSATTSSATARPRTFPSAS